MRILRSLLCTIAAIGVALANEDGSNPQRPGQSHPPLTSLQGYPGMLSREAVEAAVDAEIRDKITSWLTEGNGTRIEKSAILPLQRQRALAAEDADFTGLNEILQTFEINIPEQNIMADVLGVTAMVNIIGVCGDIQIDQIFLDYNKGGSSSLTYKVGIDNLDLKCQIDVDWDLGVLDVSDKLRIRLVLQDNDFSIAVTLKGSPPDTSTFSGCEALVNVASISSSGGFSSDILNELSDLIIQIVKEETEALSDLICEFVTDLTGTVDELLMTLGTTLAPYLTKVKEVDPLQLEKDLNVDEELLDWQDSTIGFVIQVFIDNLQGVVGAFQINTLIELNLLNDKGVFVLDLEEDEATRQRKRKLQEEDDVVSRCLTLPIRRRRLGNNLLSDMAETVEEVFESSPFYDMAQSVEEVFEESPLSDMVQSIQGVFDAELGDVLSSVLPNSLRRHLDEVIDLDNLFILNSFNLTTVEIIGLNSFQDTDYLEIISQYTFRSKIELKDLGVRITLKVDFDVNGLNRKETIVATVPIEGVFVTASYLIGLSQATVDSYKLADLVNTTNLLPCINAALVAGGLSQLDVTVKEVGTPVVQGVIDTGVDGLINTAVEAAICTYQDLILTAIPNIFQNNVTVIVNDFIECYIRTEAVNAVCVQSPSSSIIESSGLFDESDESSGTSGESFAFTSGTETETTFDYTQTGGTTSSGATDDSDTDTSSAQDTGGDTSSTGTSSSTSSSTSTSTSSTGTSTSTTSTSTSTSTTSTSTTTGEKASFIDGVSSVGGQFGGFIDFRDLLLPPDEAKVLGGSGQQPYGDLIAMAFDMLRSKMAGTDNTTGLPTINTDIMLPLSTAQSGVSGMFHFAQELFNVSLDTSMFDVLGSLLRRIEIRATDAKVGNVDTVVNPFSFLQPTGKPYILENIFHFGPVSGRPLNTTVVLNLGIGEMNSAFALLNDVGISATTSELDVLADLRLLVPAERFLQFPLNDIININCWLALLQGEQMSVKGVGTINSGLAIHDFLMKVASMTMDLECLNCTSNLLPGVLEIFGEVGATKALGDRMGLLIEELFTNDVAPSFLTQFLRLGESAATLCPHHPSFNTSVDTRGAAMPFQMPPLSYRSIDTMVFTTILGAEVLGVLFADSFLDIPSNASSPVPTTQSISDEGNLLDWTRLNETFIPFAGKLLDMARDYLGPQDGGSMGINQMLGGILQEDGSLLVSFDNTTFELPGMTVSVDSVQMMGLDTFSSFDILQPDTPRTLQNSMVIDSLSLMVSLSINATSTTDPPLPFSVSLDVDDVNISASVFASIDMDELAALEIGSMLFVERILPCFLSTANDIHLAAMQVTIGNMSNPVIVGLLPDTADAASESMKRLFETFGPELTQALNLAFDASLREMINDLIATSMEDTDCIKFGGDSLVTADGDFDGVIDFRDLLLAPEAARRLGGSGTQPYGDLFSTMFSLLQESILDSGASEGLLELNSMIVDPFTVAQSGKKGSLRFPNELFAGAWNLFSIGSSVPLSRWLAASLFDVRIDNLNTLVAPLSVLQPSHQAHVIENVINVGPSNHSMNTTLGFSFSSEGSLPLFNMHNEFDLSASVREMDIFADVALQVSQGDLFRFPLGDILEMNCWLSMISLETPAGALGLEIKTLMTSLVSLSMDLKCLNCTNTVLPKLVKAIDEAGVSEVLGNRFGPFLQEVSSSPWLQTVMKGFVKFGDDAAKLCPHSALYSEDLTNTTSEFSLPSLPPISDLSLDSLLFVVAVATEMATVLVADSHVQGYNQAEIKAIDEAWQVPDVSNALDWTNLNDTEVPFIAQILQFVDDHANGASNSSSTPPINSLLAGMIGENGHLSLPLGDISFETLGFELTFHHVELQGLTSFSKFQVLQGTSPQVLSNQFTLDELTVGLNISIDILATSDPPKHIDFSVRLQDIEASIPLFFALDGKRLGSIMIGSLLHSANIMPCLMSAISGIRLQEMLVSVGNIVGVAVHGFLPETGSALTQSVTAVLEQFGETIVESLPKIFDGSVKVLINKYLSGLEQSECQEFSTDLSSPFIDFRELFSTAEATNPFGDIIPHIKSMLDSVLHSIDPISLMPRVNDMIIAPVTEWQSGVQGTLGFQGELFAQTFEGFEEAGIDHLSFSLFDARVENLDTFGQPLKVLEPNATSGFLLDNRASIGTEVRPLRLGIKSKFRFASSILNANDEMEIFGTLSDVPFFAVLLARLGSQELLTYPLRHLADINCWLATIVSPALSAILHGNNEIDAVLALHYAEMMFTNLRIGATCLECTTPGLAILPDLLEIFDESGSKDVLARRAFEVGVDMLQSDFFQVWLLKFLQESMRLCPRTAALEENNIILASPGFSAITPRLLETGAFALFVFLQTGAVVLAQTAAVLGAKLAPVFKDPQPDYPPETRLVDFTALDTYPVGGLVKYFIEGVNSFLGEPSIDPETGETSLGINEVLGENPLFSWDTFEQEFDDLGIDVSGFKISLKSLSISGLDTFTKFRIMDISGPTSLQNELAWERLQLEVSVDVEVVQPEGSPQTEEKSSYTLVFEATDIHSSLEVMLALDYELLQNLEMGSLLRMGYILPCMQAAIRHLELSEVSIDVGKISKMQLIGFESQETSMAAESFERLMLDKFGGLIADATPSLFSVAVRPLLNTAITSYFRDSDFSCDEFPFDTEGSGFIDFRDFFLTTFFSKKYGGSGKQQYGDLISAAYGILQLQLASAHPENGIEMLTPLVGSLSYPGEILNQGMRFDVRQMQADLTLRVSDLSVTNLDSIGQPLSIITPVREEAHLLNNTGTFGVGQRPVGVGARIYMHIKGFGDVDIVNDFDLSLDVHSATLVLTALLKVSETAFVKFPLRDILNINCWLSLIPPPPLDVHGFRGEGHNQTAALTDLDFTASRLNMALNCHNCTSPAILELGKLLSSPGSSEDMTNLANEVIASITENLGGAFLQDQINRLLVEAPKHCGHHSAYDPDATPTAYQMFTNGKPPSSSYIPIFTMVFFPIVLALGAALFVRRVVSRRQKQWLSSLPSEQIFLIQQKQERKYEAEAGINKLSSSMYRSEEIPFVLRQLIPVIVVVNIGFFLSGHLNDGGRVLIHFVIGGELFALDDFFIFSIGQSTIDMWHAGGKELAVLILLFSGVWPYTKQLITLALWFLPPSVVSCTRRGQFLVWLDILAKWSMIDIVVMLITVAGFRVSIKSPSLAFIPSDMYAIELFVVPMWGLYANMIAQLISQISSHFIVHYHRRIAMRAQEKYDHELEMRLLITSSKTLGKQVQPIEPRSTQEDDDTVTEQLCRQSFAREHRVGAEKLVVRPYVNGFILFGSLMTCVMLVIACAVPSMKLEALGIVGLLIELGQGLKQAVRYEGVFTIAKLLIEQAVYLGGITNYIGLVFLAFLFVATVLIVPILQIMTLLYHWFAPISPKQRKKMANVLEILQAWQYSEVFILAVIIESWQLGSISKLMLNHFCTSLDFTLNLLVYYGVLGANDAQCFAIEASITAGAYLLVPLTAGMALLNTFVVRAYVQQLRQKEENNFSFSEDEKLRAFDRTTWDSRVDALQAIQAPDINFSDTFRWTLRQEGVVETKGCWRRGATGEASQALKDETKSLTKTLGSDEEHGPKMPSMAETLTEGFASGDQECDESSTDESNE